MSADPADLSNLRDLALPPPIPWWPPAPGWWILAAGMLVIAAILAAKGWAGYRANAYRRQAGRELNTIERRGDAAALSELLKRTALAAYPRQQVAALSGSAWLIFLDQTGGTTDFTAGAGSVLSAAAFDPSHVLSEPQFAAVVACTRHWVRGHRPC